MNIIIDYLVLATHRSASVLSLSNDRELRSHARGKHMHMPDKKSIGQYK